MGTTTSPANGEPVPHGTDHEIPASLPLAALWWRERGLRVLPLRPRGKEPFSAAEVARVAGWREPSAGGFKQASDDVEVIRRWWHAWPEANVAAALPPDRVVLDLDCAEASELLAELGFETGETLTVATARGFHFHYRVAASTSFQQITLERALAQAGRLDALSSAQRQIASRIELRVGGKGYCVLPPSVHPSGRRYALVGSVLEPAPAPAWIVQLFGPRNAQASPARNGHGSSDFLAALRGLSSGERDAGLFRFACALQRRGFSSEEAEGLMRLAWERIEQPPGDSFPWNKARQKLVQASRYAPANDSRTASPSEAPAFTELLPFSASPSLPPFPLDALPPALRDMADDVSHCVQTPADLPALLGLGVLAAAGSYARLWVRVHNLPPQPVCLYVAPVLRPSERKSSAFDAMVAPLVEFEATLCRQQWPQILAEREILATEESHLRTLRRQASEATESTERQALAREVAAQQAALPSPPPEPCLIVADTTQEGLAVRLSEQGGRLAVFDTEGSLFSIALGRYSSGVPSFDVLLRAWSADALRVDRKGSRSIRIARPVLTVCVTLQPDVLRQLGERRETVARGLISRFLFALPESRVGTRLFRDHPIRPETRLAYQAAVLRLLQLPAPPLAGNTLPPERMLRFEDNASAAWTRFHDETERALAPGGALEAIPDWGGKLAANVARIAALLHAVEVRTEPWSTPIRAESVERAATIGVYLREHALAAYQTLGADPTTALALRAWEAIRRHGWQDFAPRDLYRALGETPKTLASALEVLTERGYLRLLPPQGKATGQTGPAPGPRYQVRPELVE